MSSKLTYILVFAVTFVCVTSTLILLNEKYNNIFEFDFSPKKQKKEVIKKIKLDKNDRFRFKKYVKERFYGEIVDSLDFFFLGIKADTLVREVVKDSSLIEKLDSKDIFIANLEKENSKRNDEIAELKKKLIEKAEFAVDSKYQNWLKSTVKLYETLDSKKVAKIILNYSDNIATDLIYSMKKKKAAEVMDNFSPETVLRLTKAH